MFFYRMELADTMAAIINKFYIYRNIKNKLMLYFYYEILI